MVQNRTQTHVVLKLMLFTNPWNPCPEISNPHRDRPESQYIPGVVSRPPDLQSGSAGSRWDSGKSKSYSVYFLLPWRHWLKLGKDKLLTPLRMHCHDPCWPLLEWDFLYFHPWEFFFLLLKILFLKPSPYPTWGSNPRIKSCKLYQLS